MDPVLCLLPEILENIWAYLEIPDLLSCRLVSTSWDRCLKSDTVWRRYGVSEATSSWNSFLKMQKLNYHWSRGIYKQFTIDICEAKFAISSYYIFIARRKQMKCYSPILEEEYYLDFKNDIVGIHPFSDLVAVVLLERKFKYKISVYSRRALRKDFLTDMNSISAGKSLICFRVGSKIVVYDGHTEYALDAPGDLIELSVMNDRVLAKVVSPVHMGSNCSLYLLVDREWEMVWKSRNSPLGYMFAHIEVTSHFLALVEVVQRDEAYLYSDLQLRGKGALDKIASSRNDYFCSCSSGDTLVYTQSEGLLKILCTSNWTWKEMNVHPGLKLVKTRGSIVIAVYKDWCQVMTTKRNYSYKVTSPIVGAAAEKGFLALWSKTELLILNFNQ